MTRKRLPGRLNLLTVREVMNAATGDHGDGGGLILRVDGTSARWVFRFTSPAGRRREMGLGVADRGNPEVAGASIKRARKAATEARDLLAEQRDPIDVRADKRQAAKADERAKRAAARVEQTTLLRAARVYHERVIEPNRTTKHSAQWIASIEGPRDYEARPERIKLGALLCRPISSVTGPELLDALIDLQAALPETASRVRQRLEAIFDDAEFRGLCTGNPARAIRRKLREAMPARERGQFAALAYSDAPTFFAELSKRDGIAAQALRFAMLTASRTGEVLGATWSELDVQAGTWTVPAGRMKGSEEHTAFLSPLALELLSSLPEVGSFPFPSPLDQRQPLSNMGMLTLLRRMGKAEVTTVHGLCRATFSTWAYETAAARPDVIEACLAHKEGDRVKAAYNRARFNAERRALLHAWALFLSGSAPAAREPVAAATPAGLCRDRPIALPENQEPTSPGARQAEAPVNGDAVWGGRVNVISNAG